MCIMHAILRSTQAPYLRLYYPRLVRLFAGIVLNRNMRAECQGKWSVKRPQNGFSSATSVARKSSTFPVTTTAPRARAVAAIIRSVPPWPISWLNRPQIRASSDQNGRIRSENNCIVRSTQVRKSAAKAGFCRSCVQMPRSISAIVMTLRNRSPSALPRSQAATCGARSGRRAVEITLVSKRYIRRPRPAGASASGQAHRQERPADGRQSSRDARPPR